MLTAVWSDIYVMRCGVRVRDVCHAWIAFQKWSRKLYLTGQDPCIHIYSHADSLSSYYHWVEVSTCYKNAHRMRYNLSHIRNSSIVFENSCNKNKYIIWVIRHICIWLMGAVPKRNHRASSWANERSTGDRVRQRCTENRSSRSIHITCVVGIFHFQFNHLTDELFAEWANKRFALAESIAH